MELTGSRTNTVHDGDLEYLYKLLKDVVEGRSVDDTDLWLRKLWRWLVWFCLALAILAWPSEVIGYPVWSGLAFQRIGGCVAGAIRRILLARRGEGGTWTADEGDPEADLAAYCYVGSLRGTPMVGGICDGFITARAILHVVLGPAPRTEFCRLSPLGDGSGSSQCSTCWGRVVRAWCLWHGFVFEVEMRRPPAISAGGDGAFKGASGLDSLVCSGFVAGLTVAQSYVPLLRGAGFAGADHRVVAGDVFDFQAALRRWSKK